MPGPWAATGVHWKTPVAASKELPAGSCVGESVIDCHGTSRSATVTFNVIGINSSTVNAPEIVMTGGRLAAGAPGVPLLALDLQ